MCGIVMVETHRHTPQTHNNINRHLIVTTQKSYMRKDHCGIPHQNHLIHKKVIWEPPFGWTDRRTDGLTGGLWSSHCPTRQS